MLSHEHGTALTGSTGLQRAIDVGYICSVCLSIFCEVRSCFCKPYIRSFLHSAIIWLFQHSMEPLRCCLGPYSLQESMSDVLLGSQVLQQCQTLQTKICRLPEPPERAMLCVQSVSECTTCGTDFSKGRMPAAKRKAVNALDA